MHLCNFCGDAAPVRVMNQTNPVLADRAEMICVDCWPEWGHPENDWQDYPLEVEMADKPQWQGVTLYLVTTTEPHIWGAHDTLRDAAMAADFMDSNHDNLAPHIWEVQIGQAPVDVTDEARKLVEGK